LFIFKTLILFFQFVSIPAFI